jgi:general secretion pathway protein L
VDQYSFSDFWHWCRGVLSGLVWRHLPFLRSQNAEFIVRVTADDVCLCSAGGTQNDRQSDRQSETFPLVEIQGQLAKAFAGRSVRERECTIRLAPDRFVLRQLSLYALSASQLMSAAQLDLETHTPFDRAEVHILPIAVTGRSSGYAIVKNSILQPVLDAVRTTGGLIDGIEFETQTGLRRLASSASGMFSRPQGKWQTRAAAICASLLMIVVGATFVHASVRNQTAIVTLQLELDRLAGDSKIARQALDARTKSLAQLAALRNSIEESESVAKVWEELARVLPDSAYLTDLTVKGTEVSIAGYGVDAAHLVVSLEQSPLFSQASFTGPVTKAPGMDSERFEANFMVGAN